MGVEIERKFLVKQGLMPVLTHGIYIAQGYIQTVDHTVVRVRIKGDKGFLTLKSQTQGLTRLEYEYEIPFTDAKELVQTLCAGKTIEKTRYELTIGKHVWEIDVFAGENQGLIVAEVELQSETEAIVLPDWVKEEVTGQPAFYNNNLMKHPYLEW